MKAKFIGEDKSMGFRHGEIYDIKTKLQYDLWSTNSSIWVHGTTKKNPQGYKCPYSSLENLVENWEIISTGFPRLDNVVNVVNQDDALDATRYAVEYLAKKPKADKHEELTKQLNKTYRDKNKDYGDAFGKSHDKYGAVAGLTRISDKFHRLEELTLSGEQLVQDESVLDTLLDLANYSLMLHMELDGEK